MAAVPRGGAREGATGPVASGLWLRAEALSGEALAGSTQATSEAAHVGEAVAARGRGEPRASQPGAALS